MDHYDEGEWCHISGRGWVFITKNKEECVDYSRLLNKEVSIQGHIYTVVGIERHAVAHQRVGAPIGLLIRGPRKEVIDTAR